LSDIAATPDAALIDIGGGTARLVDALIEAQWTSVTVLDLSTIALDIAKVRLGSAAVRVRWIVADVTQWGPARQYDIWHDRAVFHFLTEPSDRAAYSDRLRAAVRPGGHAIIATFAPDGPERCSGLPVLRYDAQTLAGEIGPPFVLLRSREHVHLTPAGIAAVPIHHLAPRLKGSTARRHRAAVDVDYTVEQTVRVREAGFGRHDRESGFPQAGDDLGEAPRQHRCHAFEGLVEEQEPAARHHGAGQRHELLLAARKLQRLAGTGEFAGLIGRNGPGWARQRRPSGPSRRRTSRQGLPASCGTRDSWAAPGSAPRSSL
jgi:SAM-dependent methyltransferase